MNTVEANKALTPGPQINQGNKFKPCSAIA